MAPLVYAAELDPARDARNRILASASRHPTSMSNDVQELFSLVVAWRTTMTTLLRSL